MKKYILFILAFLILIGVMTFPLFTGLARYIPGFSSTDEPFMFLWHSWQTKFCLIHSGILTDKTLLAYPFGNDLSRPGFFSLWNIIFYALSFFTDPALTFNLQIIFNFLATALITYLLVFFLTQSNLGAVFAALIFSFSPYMFARAWQHLGLTYIEWIPLVLLSAILLREKPAVKSKVLFSISIFLLFSFDYSITYMGLVALGLFLLYVLVANGVIKRKLDQTDVNFFKNIVLIGVIFFAVIFIQIYPFIRDSIKFYYSPASAHNAYHRPFADLFVQSARPLSYLLPATTHPLLGKFSEQFIGTSLYGTSLTEHALYLGWVPLILALSVFLRWKRHKLQGREGYYAGFFLVLAVGAWLFSQPPWWDIGPLKIYMPSFFMYKILPMFRAYCRFGAVVMLAVAALAGFGLKYILERFKSKKARVAAAVLICGAVLFEFWSYPPYKVIDVSTAPAVYSWLKNTPADAVVAEYPLDADSNNDMYKFYQTKHEKRMINSTSPGTYANKVAKKLVRLSGPATAGMLKWMGVRFVLVHKSEYLDSGLVDDREELKLIPENSGLRRVLEFPQESCPDKDIMCVQKTGPIDVYEVIAAPIEPRAKE